MTNEETQSLKDLTTVGQLASAVSLLIKSGDVTVEEFKAATKDETPDSFSARVLFWSMVNYENSDKQGFAIVNAVKDTLIEIIK